MHNKCFYRGAQCYSILHFWIYKRNISLLVWKCGVINLKKNRIKKKPITVVQFQRKCDLLLLGALFRPNIWYTFQSIACQNFRDPNQSTISEKHIFILLRCSNDKWIPNRIVANEWYGIELRMLSASSCRSFQICHNIFPT